MGYERRRCSLVLSKESKYARNSFLASSDRPSDDEDWLCDILEAKDDREDDGDKTWKGVGV